MSTLHKTTYTAFNDFELVRATARGNDLCYAELMRRYMRSVFHFATGFVGIDKAKEITEETFYIFWKKAEHTKSDQILKRSLFDVATILIRKHLKKINVLPHPPILYLEQTQKFKIPKVSLLEAADRLKEKILGVRSWYDRLEAPFTRINTLPT